MIAITCSPSIMRRMKELPALPVIFTHPTPPDPPTTVLNKCRYAIRTNSSLPARSPLALRVSRRAMALIAGGRRGFQPPHTHPQNHEKSCTRSKPRSDPLTSLMFPKCRVPHPNCVLCGSGGIPCTPPSNNFVVLSGVEGSAVALPGAERPILTSSSAIRAGFHALHRRHVGFSPQSGRRFAAVQTGSEVNPVFTGGASCFSSGGRPGFQPRQPPLHLVL